MAKKKKKKTKRGKKRKTLKKRKAKKAIRKRIEKEAHVPHDLIRRPAATPMAFRFLDVPPPAKTFKEGVFITFEGIEGCGKSTHVWYLVNYLKSLGYSVLHTREPGGTRLGAKIRNMLLHSGESLAKYAEVFLFLADRVQHIEKVIQPALEKGKIVICDRFVDSTIAYQVGGRKLEKRIMNYLNSLVAKEMVPNLTFLLMVNPKIGLERARTSRKHRITVKDRFEEEPLDFHQRVYQAYKEIADKNKERIRVIDTSRDLRSVQIEIRKIIDQFLKGRQ